MKSPCLCSPLVRHTISFHTTQLYYQNLHQARLFLGLFATLDLAECGNML